MNKHNNVNRDATAKFVLRRTEPRPWLERMYDDNADLFEPSSIGELVEIEVCPQRQSELRHWVGSHGDTFDDVFRPANRLGKQYRPRGIQVYPGGSAELHSNRLNEELRAGIIDLHSVECSDGVLKVTARVPRVIPDSGLFGRMGRFDATIVFENATGFELHDPDSLRAIPVFISHCDPSSKKLYLGAPSIGYLDADVASTTCRLTMSSEPSQVRRFLRWKSVGS